MGEYGVTDKGFILKRMDRILEELHSDLSEGFKFNTRIDPQSFISVLATTFAGQMADLWETAQESYFAKYPSTAYGINLDNANQYGGIRRGKARRTYYLLHCTGEEGTHIPSGCIAASDTQPKLRLFSENDFTISRARFNRAVIRIAALEPDGIYTISLNGSQYSYLNERCSKEDVLEGLAKKITSDEYSVSISDDRKTIAISDKITARTGMLVLSENLTTVSVTVIENFGTEEYGKFRIPNGMINEIITRTEGLKAVENLIEPTLGRLTETDTEFRHSYLLKSAIRSSRMVDSITSRILNSVAGIETARGYENCTDITDSEGRPPHSIEIVAEGGNEQEIAEIILAVKAGGIQTYGKVCVMVPGMNGDTIPVSFNRPEYIHVWIKITLFGNKALIPINFASLAVNAVIEKVPNLVAGESLRTQLLHEGIYQKVAGVDYIDIKAAASTDPSYLPEDGGYTKVNIHAGSRQKILIDAARIEVEYGGSI